MSDSELETWLFVPGPCHNKALLWALIKIAPEICDQLHTIQEENREKAMVRWFEHVGLVKPTESDKVLGHAPRKELKSFWDSVLHQICILQDFENQANHRELKPDDGLSTLFSLVSSPDFWDRLQKEPSFLPVDIVLPPWESTLDDLRDELDRAEEKLNLYDESNSFSGSGNSFDGSSAFDKPKKTQKNILEFVANQKSNIDKCYQAFLLQVVKVIKRSPPNPVAKELAQIVSNLHGKVHECAEFLQNVNETRNMAMSFSSQELPTDYNLSKNDLQDFISTMCSEITSINSIISANKDLLGL